MIQFTLLPSLSAIGVQMFKWAVGWMGCNLQTFVDFLLASMPNLFNYNMRLMKLETVKRSVMIGLTHEVAGSEDGYYECRLKMSR